VVRAVFPAPLRSGIGRPVALLLIVVLLLGACSAGGSDGESGTAPVPSAQWKTLSSAPDQRTEVAAAAAGNKIYIAGGLVPPGRTVPTVEVYDIATDSYSRGPDLPLGVNHAMATAWDGVVYVLGGYADATGLAAPTNRAFALKGESWEELPPMPEVRAAGGAAAIDGKIYVAGGVGPSGLASTTMVFDIAEASWSTAEGVPTQREHLGVATDGRKLYVVGGRPPNTDVLEAFDPVAGEWERLPDMPTARGGLAAAGTDDGLIVAAGGEADATFPEVEAYNVREDRWVILEDLPTPRHGLGVVAVGNTVYVVAGGPQPGFAFSGANEALDLS
jgi:N-acetylneuraminic acid mutarotase